MTRRLHLRLATLACCLLPAICAAATIDSWEFGTGKLPTGWQVNGNPAIRLTDTGLVIEAGNEAAQVRKEDLAPTRPIQAVQITYTAPTALQLHLLWVPQTSTGTAAFMIPVNLSAAAEPKTVDIDILPYEELRGLPSSVGINVSADTTITLQRLGLLGWNPAERLGTAVASFFEFDVLRPSSVNFLWGPRLATTPVVHDQMYLILPPRAASANTLFYVLAGLSIVLAVWQRRRGHWTRPQALKIVGLCLASLWILYDLRMGAEVLSYVHYDYQTYHSQPVGERSFRERAFFNDFAEAVAGQLDDEPQYIFMAEYRWPYLGLIRYLTYPSIPTHPTQENVNSIRTWVVYRRPDIVRHSNGQLFTDGVPISPPGEIVHEFAPGSFIFRTTAQ